MTQLLRRMLATAGAALQRRVLGVSTEEIRYTIADVRAEIRATRAELLEQIAALRADVERLVEHERALLEAADDDSPDEDEPVARA